MRRRILAVPIALTLAAAFVPTANAQYTVPRTQPPHCGTVAGNVVLGDPICEATELEP